jgi:hypothetical protein
MCKAGAGEQCEVLDKGARLRSGLNNKSFEVCSDGNYERSRVKGSSFIRIRLCKRVISAPAIDASDGVQPEWSKCAVEPLRLG